VHVVLSLTGESKKVVRELISYKSLFPTRSPIERLFSLTPFPALFDSYTRPKVEKKLHISTRTETHGTSLADIWHSSKDSSLIYYSGTNQP